MTESKKIVLISLFFYEKTDNIRISSVYNLLTERGMDVELITTDFKHRHKIKHTIPNFATDITYIPVPTYKSNLSFGRLFSHIIFAVRLYKYLQQLTYVPSKVYCVVPTVSSGLACHYYCKKKHIPFIIDIVDLWPESFIILSKHKKLLTLLTWPWQLMARKVYRSADNIFTGSIDYAKYVGQYTKKTKPVPIYLGTDRERFKLAVAQSTVKIDKPEGQIWICYGGVLENSYDFETVLHCFKRLTDEGFNNLKLIFIGDGQQRKMISDYKEKFNLPIQITGYLKYADYLNYLSHSDVALNSFKKGTRVAYSYKFNDYISAGIPVLNNLIGETSDLIEKHEIGLNFNYSDSPLYKNISYLLTHPELLAQMKKNCTFVADHVLAKNIVYQEMMNKFMME